MDDDVWECWVGRRCKCEEITLEGTRSCFVTFTLMIGIVRIMIPS